MMVFRTLDAVDPLQMDLGLETLSNPELIKSAALYMPSSNVFAHQSPYHQALHTLSQG